MTPILSPIVTVTLNPALDLSTATPRVEAGRKLRCRPETAEAGGGGVNVARAVTQLGGEAEAWLALGGANGTALGAILDGLGLAWRRLEAPGPTRHSFSVTEGESGQQYRFVLSGPVWRDADLEAVLARLAGETPQTALIVFSGSMPPGAKPGFLSRATARLAPRRVVIDTSGPHLEHQAQGHDPVPFVLRMDSHEARDLSGETLGSRDESVAFAEKLRQRGAGEVVIIARGADGSVMAEPGGLWHVTAANQRVVSAIGAGDSFVGGFCLGIAQGKDNGAALRMGAAAASAACLSEGTQLCLPQDYAAILPRTELTTLGKAP